MSYSSGISIKAKKAWTSGIELRECKEPHTVEKWDLGRIIARYTAICTKTKDHGGPHMDKFTNDTWVDEDEEED